MSDSTATTVNEDDLNRLTRPKLAVWYVLALVLVALLTIFGWWITRQRLVEREADAHEINIAGMQRMKSVETVVLVKSLYDTGQEERHRNARSLTSKLDEINATYAKLRNESDSKGVPRHRDDITEQRFSELARQHVVLDGIAHRIEDASEAAATDFTILSQEFLEAHKKYLTLQMALVDSLERESEQRTSTLGRWDSIRMLGILLLLLLEAVFIFVPVTRKFVSAFEENVRSRESTEVQHSQLQRSHENLQETLAKVLEGVNPICAQCKSVRDDDGKWHPIESILSGVTRARFSHSICDECAASLYPDLDLNSSTV